MKNALIALPIIGILSACGTSPVSKNTQTDLEYRQQAKVATQAISQAPIWMTKLPKEPGVIYENGTAISSDFSMADLKAKTMAYVKICTGAGGKVRSQMKMYRADSDAASIEQSELTVRSICPDVDITGVETVEMKHVAEGNRIRTYVLVALPMGSKNLMKSSKDLQNRSPEAFKELDSVSKEQQAAPNAVPQAEPVQSSRPAPARAVEQPQARAPSQPAAIVEPIPLERIEAPLSPTSTIQGIPPATKRDGSLLESVRAVGNDTVVVQSADGSERQLGLLGAKNPEYVARRAQALNKPGAVIAQVAVE
ncbi:hypothetical protein [Polynucleobacter sp.]|jgi:hypothetical protein|uniref:hypothetical protein n=1 Tax=Polynucleobacter sp. TaxID=2029855 RepID=UPI002734F514|nr:hypothetical protein [Polynucleobacter sp.]MDP3122387.1 hypothetical protein [Polynucleobacter sp.]